MEASQSTTIKAALEYALDVVKKNSDVFGLEFPARGYPAYETVKNDLWVTGFWPGMLWLAFKATADPGLKEKVEALLPGFAQRLEERINIDHDLGFLYTLSARASWLCTENKMARDMGIKAAAELGKRFNPNGGYIQACGLGKNRGRT